MIRLLNGATGLIRHALAAALAAGMTLSLPAYSQQQGLEDLAREIEALKAGQAQIRAQLGELEALLQARGKTAAPPRRSVADDLQDATFSLAGDPVRGAADARLVMMEFSDYQCPYCARHTSRVLPDIEREYVATGKLQYAFRDFPLERIHKEAFRAAQAANCAGEQGRYWEMHDALFANRRAIEPFVQRAESAGVADLEAFQACLDSGRHAEEVRADMSEGRHFGVRSTPTFVLGVRDEAGNVHGARIVRGALAFERLKQEIDRLLGTL